ncbi:MAG: hypothetical protein V8R26_03980 [Clostridia bacterium]|jgi:hypothetical protein|nr:hypothetical protein [Clostridiaceae bacterium]
MSTNSRLKKEGIEIVEQLDTLKVNTIAISIASKLCLAFPEHNLNKSELFTSLSRINMYIAKMPEDSAGAKYFYKNNSIYFNKEYDLDEMAKLAMHECIHYIQEFRDANNNLVKMGLYNCTFNSGLGINEAAVQLMASEANMCPSTSETYYNVSLNTISPNYYPLECALVNQMAYFTGTYPLFHSTLNSNDVFKNTFILKSNKRAYNTIVKNIDLLLAYENDLNYFASELQYANKVSEIKLLNKLIASKKDSITSIFFKTQNLIIESCFISEFNNIRNLEDVKEYKNKLYNFKNIMGSNENYTFYNEFYRKIMESLEKKKEQIEQFGEINLFETSENSLVLVDNTKRALSFVSTFFVKVKKLFGFNKSRDTINNLY